MAAQQHLRSATLTLAAVTALILTGCSGEDDKTAVTPKSESASASTSATPEQQSASPSGSASPSTNGSGSASPSGGGSTPSSQSSTAAGAADLRAMSWRTLGDPDTPQLVSGGWAIRQNLRTGAVSFKGKGSLKLAPAPGRRTSNVLADGKHALVVQADKNEERADLARVVDLGSGKATRLRGPAPTPDATWALGDGRVRYSTMRSGRFCMAETDLASGRSTVGYCAKPGSGFFAMALTDDGDTMTTQKMQSQSQSACRTLVGVDGKSLEPISGPPKCKGWDAVALGDGHVWSYLPKEQRSELAHFHASLGGKDVDLGEGAAGSLVRCGSAAYFTRDAGPGGKAKLFRVDATGTVSTVMTSIGKGSAFFQTPRCGGDHLTVTTQGEGGDRQATTPVS